jgi:hypothetical protein
MSDKQFARFVSTSLKQFGFRHGAPIHRATADLTLDQMLNALSHNETATFRPRNGEEPVTVTVESVRSLGLRTVVYMLDDVPGFKTGSSPRIFVIEGSLWNGEAAHRAAAYDRGESEHYPWPLAMEDPDFYLTVVALVSFGDDGQVLDVIVQRVPSRADEILTIPPM